MKSILLCLLLILASCCSTKAITPQPTVKPSVVQIVEKPDEEEKAMILARLVDGPHPAVHILFMGPVTYSSVNTIMVGFGKAAALEAKSVVLEINSGGGDVDAGFLLAKVMENAPIPIHCVVDGNASSMAFYLLQSCTTREMTKRSLLMAHQPSIETTGSASKLQNASEHLVVLWRALSEHWSKRTKVGVDEFLRKTADGREWWMGWEEALKVGAVDGVFDVIQEADVKWVK